MDGIKSTYKELAEIPVLISARIVGTIRNSASIQTYWSQSYIDQGKKLKVFQEYTVDLDKRELEPTRFPIDVSSELMTAYSQDNSLKAVLRDIKVDGKSKQFIEIWNKRKIIGSYDLTAYDVHGKVYTDTVFGSFELSPDNRKLMYIAEKKLQKSEPFFSSKLDCASKSKDESVVQGCEYEYKQNWGETFEDKHRSVIAVLDLNNRTIEVVDVEDVYFPAQTIWASNSKDIAGVVYKLEPRYLGMAFYTNRESYIFCIKNKSFQILTESNNSCRSPRMTPDGKYIAYITRAVTPPHQDSQSFKFIRWDDGQEQEASDESKNLFTDKFYGLYNESFPKRCFSQDSKYLFLSTPNVWTIRSYFISLENNQVAGLVDSNEDSLVVLDVNKDLVVFARSSLNEPSHLVVAKFFNGKIGELIGCRQDEIPSLKALSYKLQLLMRKDAEKEIQTFNYIYLGRKNATEKSLPVVTVLHGGPHSVINNQFNLIYAFFASIGFGVLMINYRGSTGSDPKTLESLMGRIGDQDYEDCLDALGCALTTIPELDCRRLTLFGGSHGGFLTAHISARQSRCFKAVVMRNPVIDLAAKFTIADNPDGCTAGINCPSIKAPEDVKPPKENYINLKREMLFKSPIIYVDQCKVPTMIALGSKDLRCPPSQGKMWYQHLRKNNVDTKLYWYDDGHSLTKFEVAIDFHMNAAIWLMKYIQLDVQTDANKEIMDLIKRSGKFVKNSSSN